MAPGEDGTVAAVTLRLLATTDIHLQMLGHDYVQDRPIGHHGFAGLAHLIRQARADAAAAGAACVLLDNGDFLQGTALEWELTRQPRNADHPLVQVLNDLRYDALGLGNHDLDHGLDLVSELATHLVAPVVCANLVLSGESPLVPWALIQCAAPGASEGITLGVVSALPEKTALWNRRELAGQARVEPGLPAVRRAVHALRAAGADIVVLLAHMGPSINSDTDEARSLATAPDIDAVILGHTHLRLPGSDHMGVLDVDAQLGSLHQRPCVMAGFDASDLAVLDLHLAQNDQGRWEVLHHVSRLWPNTSQVPADAPTAAAFAPAHARTRAALAEPCGHLGQPVQNYFSLAAPTGTCALVANAGHQVVARALAGGPWEGLPILAAAAAHKAGGRGGPHNFLHIEAGQLFRRQLMGLSPYANDICALRVTGQELRFWLENAAEVYTRLRPGAGPQPLLRREKPSFDFDTIYGLTYTIDPKEPVGQRISALCHAGAPVTPTQEFILATNNFRAAGGGGGTIFGEEQIICRTGVPLLTALEHALQDQHWHFPLYSHPWHLQQHGTVEADLRTAPQALPFLQEIAALTPTPQGRDAQGFEIIRLTL